MQICHGELCQPPVATLHWRWHSQRVGWRACSWLQKSARVCWVRSSLKFKISRALIFRLLYVQALMFTSHLEGHPLPRDTLHRSRRSRRITSQDRPRRRRLGLRDSRGRLASSTGRHPGVPLCKLQPSLKFEFCTFYCNTAEQAGRAHPRN